MDHNLTKNRGTHINSTKTLNNSIELKNTKAHKFHKTVTKVSIHQTIANKDRNINTLEYDIHLTLWETVDAAQVTVSEAI